MSKLSQRRVFDAVGYHPHAVQKEIHAAARTARFRVVCAGRRMGKSQLGGHELTPLALLASGRDDLSPHGKRMEYWIVGPNYSDSEKEFRALYNDLETLQVPFDHPGTYYNSEGGNMHISLWGGRFLVHGKSAAHPDSLVGEGLHGVILAEAAKLKPTIWTKYARPMLADYRGWALMTSTPEGKNWFYDSWQLGQKAIGFKQQGIRARTKAELAKINAQSEWWSKRAPSWLNPAVYPLGIDDPEIQSMRNDMSAEKFNQEIGADFTEFVGRVFKDFDEELHVEHCEYDPSRPVFLCADFGYTNPTVVLAIQTDVWDNVYVLGEYYQSHRTPMEAAREIYDDPKLGPLVRVAKILYPDPEDPGAANEMAQFWKVRVMAGTGGPLKDRIELIRKWLKVPYDLMHPDVKNEFRQPRIKFDYSCTNTIREMQEYRYPDTKTEEQNARENPLKKDDHAPEALGRFFAGHFNEANPRGVAKQRRAKARR